MVYLYSGLCKGDQKEADQADFIIDLSAKSKALDGMPHDPNPSDPTAILAIQRERYFNKMEMVEQTALATDPEIGEYVFKAVTEDLSYTYLKTVLEIPCDKDLYFDRYRRFYWLLDKRRD